MNLQDFGANNTIRGESRFGLNSTVKDETQNIEMNIDNCRRILDSQKKQQG